MDSQNSEDICYFCQPRVKQRSETILDFPTEPVLPTTEKLFRLCCPDDVDSFQHRQFKGPSMLPRLMLADDHSILIEAFRKLLEPHCNIVAIAADGALLKTAKQLNPELLLLTSECPS